MNLEYQIMRAAMKPLPAGVSAQQAPMLRWWLGHEDAGLRLSPYHRHVLGEFVAPEWPFGQHYFLTQAGREALAALPPCVGGVPIG